MNNEQDCLALFYRDIRQLKVPAREEQMELAKQAQAGDKAAREKMINSNLRLVVKIAKKFKGAGLDLPDLIQEGTLGLIKSLDKFDLDQEKAFSTYASFWIIQSITRALANKGRLIRLPANINEEVLSFIKIKRALTGKLQREPTPEEIAVQVNKETDYVKQVLGLGFHPHSLDESINEDGSSFVDMLADDSAESFTDRAHLAAEIDKLFKALTPREKKVITLRFGLNGNGGNSMTLAEIGESFNVTRERVRQIEDKAMKKLKRQIRIKKLKYGDLAS